VTTHPEEHSGGETGSPAQGDGGQAPAAGGHGAHGAMEGMEMGGAVTRPQLLSVTLLTLLALAGAVVWALANYNLSISAEEVDGAIMPPGMVNRRDLPAEAMREMAAVDPGDVSYTAPADARGDRPLEARMEGGVKVYDLTASVIRWNILPDEQVMAYAINRQVPGPRIRVAEGDRVRFNVRNELPESTTLHWHGLVLPNGMDGPAEITQEPIEPGGRFTYQFTVRQAGTFFYHSHDSPDRQQGLGLFGALIIDPENPSPAIADKEAVIALQEWTKKEGYTFPAMLMEGAMPNFFTINGKAYPDTERIEMRVGERVRIRFIGSHNNFIHPMHIHGGPFTIVETDGVPVPKSAQIEKDTVNVGPGERYDVIWEARRPGKWLLHCHIPHHTTNDNVEEQGAGGLTTIIDVRS
jgi:FtsP/CotA-like multicopper oxidase with cupredoxin domain